MPQRSAVALALALLGCGHTDPFTPADQGTDQPFNPTPPVLLTLNTAADRRPAWVADGSGIVYSTQLVARLDRDVCLTVLPPTGGRQREVWCDVPGDTAVTDAIESAAPGPGGRLLFIAASGRIGSANPVTQGFALAPGLDPTNAQIVGTLPFTPAGAPPQNGADQLRWLDADRIAYLGVEAVYWNPCPGCLDTLLQGRSVNLLPISPSSSTPVLVPGTEFATGLAAAAGGNEIFYTLRGDSRVFRRSLSNGEAVVAFDFGSGLIARDIHVVGNRLVAVVGGRVAVNNLVPQFGLVQWDSGGVIHVVDLASNVDQPLDDPPRLYRRPLLSPAGDRIVAEGYGLIITDGDTGPDTTVSRESNIYLIGAP